MYPYGSPRGAYTAVVFVSCRRRLIDGVLAEPARDQAMSRQCKNHALSRIDLQQNPVVPTYLSKWVCLLELGGGCDMDTTNQQGIILFDMTKRSQEKDMHVGGEPLALQILYATRKSRRMMRDLQRRVYRYA